MNTTNRPSLSPHDLRRLAVAAELDPRSVERVLRGGRVLRSTRRLVADAAATLGLSHLVPMETSEAA